jgi:uncharacterized protein YcbX
LQTFKQRPEQIELAQLNHILAVTRILKRSHLKNLKIKKLFIYPIKSCRGINVTTANIQKTGFKYDRFFAVINSKNEILTARENSKLLHISSAIHMDKLTLSADETPSITINLTTILIEKIDISIFNDSAKAKIVGHETDAWLSHILQEKCRLVSIDSEQLRTMKSKYNGKENDFISFSDISPIHLISEESLKDLNSKLANPVTIDNFRPNILISGSLAYEEDNWSSIKIGDCEFEVSLKTPRCTFTTIDPITTKADSKQEPLRTLSTYRKAGNTINFGIYLTPKKTGIINITDDITVADNNVHN